MSTERIEQVRNHTDRNLSSGSNWEVGTVMQQHYPLHNVLPLWNDLFAKLSSCNRSPEQQEHFYSSVCCSMVQQRSSVLMDHLAVKHFSAPQWLCPQGGPALFFLARIGKFLGMPSFLSQAFASLFTAFKNAAHASSDFILDKNSPVFK